MADPPAQLAVDRQWTSNADGYIYSVGYFTPEQVTSEMWEVQRLAYRKTAHICDSERLVHRDVRWFDPIAPGEPRCARIVYSIACTPRRPEWGGSLEYERRQRLLEEPRELPSSGCGEKDGTKLPEPLSRTPEPNGVIVSEQADCKTLPDMQSGRFRLGEVNYVNARTLVSAVFLRVPNSSYQWDATHQITLAASYGTKIHVVVVDRPLADDGNNIFIEQVFAGNADRFCVTLTARQGNTRWRKSVHADLPGPGTVPRGLVKLAEDWGPYDVAKALQRELSEHIGIPIPKELVDR